MVNKSKGLNTRTFHKKETKKVFDNKKPKKTGGKNKKMVKVVEKAANESELESVCKKYDILARPHLATAMFIGIARILYESNKNVQYAVCSSDREWELELVEYDNKNDLISYCHDNGFDIHIINRDGNITFIVPKLLVKE